MGPGSGPDDSWWVGGSEAEAAASHRNRYVGDHDSWWIGGAGHLKRVPGLRLAPLASGGRVG